MRHRPPPLLRLSAGAGPYDPVQEEIMPSVTMEYRPSIRNSSLSAYESVISPSSPPGNSFRVRSSSLAAPHFPTLSMFKLGSRSKSPRRATTTYSKQAPPPPNPVSPSYMAVLEPPQRPHSPWGSTDSQSSTSPRNSARLQKGVFNKSPTFSSHRNSTIGAVGGGGGGPAMGRNSRIFLGKHRKHSSGLESEFDPTTFRKHRSRPRTPGLTGQDVLYQEYDDLFDDVVEDDGKEQTDFSSHSLYEIVNEEEDELLLDQIAEHPDIPRSFSILSKNAARSPRTSPRLRPQIHSSLRSKKRVSVPNPPRSVSASWAEGPTSNARSSVDIPSSTGEQQALSKLPSPSPPPPNNPRLSPPPPTLPPKSWKRYTIMTTTPPRSVSPSVKGSTTPPLTTVMSAPPTPPPKPELSPEQTETSNSACVVSDPIGSPGPPPHHAPPPTPPPLSKKRFSERLNGFGMRPTLVPEGLGIINIPSPTLFYSTFIQGGATDNWTAAGLCDGVSESPALASSLPSSYNSGQLAAEEGPFSGEEEDMITQGMSMLFDEAECGRVVPLSIRKEGTLGALANIETSSAFNTAYEILTARENLGDISAVTDRSIETLLEAMIDQETGMDVVHEIQDADLSVSDRSENDAEEKISANTGITNEGGGSGDKKENVVGDEDRICLQSFRTFLKSSGDNDPFIARMPRFDALQAQRICSHLRNEYPLITPHPSRRRSSTASIKSQKREAGEEILTGLWALMAVRWMNFGKVVTSPAHDVLLAASAKRLSRRITVKNDPRAVRMLQNSAPIIDNAGRERRRVLDLGGVPVADWGWHCAYDYPKAKVYTVTIRTTSKSQAESVEKPDSPASSRGPKNHRHLVVSNLWRLPFPSGHFDVVSARNLYQSLHITKKNPTNTAAEEDEFEDEDEYDQCLTECLRVLKPGGYLEFTIFDNAIINPGPLAETLTTSFSENLESKNLDPTPSKRWISRLHAARFEDIKRSWLFLPMSPPSPKPKVPSKDELHTLEHHESRDLDMVKEEVRRKMEAWEDLGVAKGSTENVSHVTGLIGSWLWERWVGSIVGEEGMKERIETLAGVLEEGKEMGSGWRVLVGWARKSEDM